MAFTSLTDPAVTGRDPIDEIYTASYSIVRTGVWWGEHNGLFEILDLVWTQPQRHNQLQGFEIHNRPNSYSLRHSLWQAAVVFPLDGDVAIEGNTVKSGGAIRPSTGFLYPRQL